MLYDYRYQSKDLIVMIDDENNLVLVGLLHVFLDRLFLHVVQFHDRIFHQQNQIERFEVEMIENVVVFVKFHFLYSIEKKIQQICLSNKISQHTNASRRVSDSSCSKIRRASCILFDISSICLRLEMKNWVHLFNKGKSCFLSFEEFPKITFIYKAYSLFCNFLHLHKIECQCLYIV